MPVGTAASVKAVHPHELHAPIRADIILSNTYHLFLRPGVNVVEAAGGVQRFSGWKGPMLTDSGGYQVFSLGKYRTLSEEGATFRSHLDGTKHLFTPENVIDVQRRLGADIIMAFDECPPYPCPYSYARQSMELTHRWLGRCVEAFRQNSCPHGYEQQLFPICQGSTYDDLRKQSAEHVASLDLTGNAIGGLSVGEPPEITYPIVEQVCGILPEDRPRYLMGVGTPSDLLECIARGVDMFDCVLPSRNARHGIIYTWRGIINLRLKRYADRHEAIDPDGPCPLTREHTFAYMRHLFVSGEYLAGQVATVHNLTFYLALVREARRRIIDGTFNGWYEATARQLATRLDRGG